MAVSRSAVGMLLHLIVGSFLRLGIASSIKHSELAPHLDQRGTIFSNESSTDSRPKSGDIQKFAPLFFHDWTESQASKLDYITRLLCSSKSEYRFYHVVIDRGLKTTIADEMLQRIHSCIAATVLVTG